MSILTKSKLFSLLPDDVRGRLAENHRLTSSSRLRNRKQAGDFILERCFVSVFSGTELPSIQEAIEGKADNPNDRNRVSSGPGIASIWLNDLPKAVPCLFGTFVKRKPTLITQKHWPALLAIEKEGFQGAREHHRISPAAFCVADCIDREGPATSEVLRDRCNQLGKMDSRIFRRALLDLEKLWLIVRSPIGTTHNTTSCVWELTNRFLPKETVMEAKNLTRRQAMCNLLWGAVDSAGVVDEKAIYRWFGWPRTMTNTLINEALSKKQLYKAHGPKPVIISTTLAEIWPQTKNPPFHQHD